MIFWFSLLFISCIVVFVIIREFFIFLMLLFILNLRVILFVLILFLRLFILFIEDLRVDFSCDILLCWGVKVKVFFRIVNLLFIVVLMSDWFDLILVIVLLREIKFWVYFVFWFFSISLFCVIFLIIFCFNLSNFFWRLFSFLYFSIFILFFNIKFFCGNVFCIFFKLDFRIFIVLFCFLIKCFNVMFLFFNEVIFFFSLLSLLNILVVVELFIFVNIIEINRIIMLKKMKSIVMFVVYLIGICSIK